jgi:hypothetical protein
LTGCATGCSIYVRDCWKTFRNLETDFASVVALEVKKLFTGLLLWKAREGTDLNADREARERVEVSFKGCRIAKAMLRDIL